LSEIRDLNQQIGLKKNKTTKSVFQTELF